MSGISRRRWPVVLAAVLLSAPVGIHGQRGAGPIMQEPQTLRLWTDRAPGALGDDDADVPTLTVYMPRNTAGPMTAVIIAPGGGYMNLAMNHEGRQPANYFNTLGVAAFVLKYRLGPRYHHPVELGDAQRAIRMVRARAGEWHIAPDRIGIMGFSAGGHLASTASTHFDAGNPSAADPIDRAGSRPDFAILGYPVITFIESVDASGIEDVTARGRARPGPCAQPLQRDAGLGHDAADVPVSHQRRHDGPGREQRAVFSGAPQSGCACGNAHLQGRRARRWPGASGSGALRMAETAGELAAGQRLYQVEPNGTNRDWRDRSNQVTFRGQTRVTSRPLPIGRVIDSAPGRLRTWRT